MHRLVRLTSIPEKVMRQLIMEATFKDHKNKKVTGSSFGFIIGEADEMQDREMGIKNPTGQSWEASCCCPCSEQNPKVSATFSGL